MTEANYIPNSRKEARATGATYYFTGKPCLRGHLAQRYAIDASCATCKNIVSRERGVRASTDVEFAEKRRKCHRESKRRARATTEGKSRHGDANKRYNEKNRDKINAYYRQRAASDPVVKMARSARAMVHRVLAHTNKRKSANCTDILGYTGTELRLHIERQFTKGMSWERFGSEIHIDHIIPVAEMVRRGVTDPGIINALANLRPMWAKDNMAKGDAIESLL